MIIALSGAMVIGLYKDPSLRTVGGSVVQRLVMLGSSSNASSKWGALCLLGNCLTWAIWFIIQVELLEEKLGLCNVMEPWAKLSKRSNVFSFFFVISLINRSQF